MGQAPERGAFLMPFKSKKQMKWMYANKPEMAKRWASETKNMKTLPNKKGKK